MTTTTVERDHTDTETAGYEPVYALTAEQIQDMKNDAFRAGYRAGLVHGAEQPDLAELVAR